MRDPRELSNSEYAVYTVTWMVLCVTTFYLVIPRWLIQKHYGTRFANGVVYIITMWAGTTSVAWVFYRTSFYDDGVNQWWREMPWILLLGVLDGLILSFMLALLSNWAGQQQQDRRAECRARATARIAAAA